MKIVINSNIVNKHVKFEVSKQYKISFLNVNNQVYKLVDLYFWGNGIEIAPTMDKIWGIFDDEKSND